MDICANMFNPNSISPKKLLREEIKRRLETTSAEEFSSQGSGAASILCSSPVWSRYPTIFLFRSMKAEIDTRPLIETALKEGKKILVPRVNEDPKGSKAVLKKLVFCPLLSLDGPWQKGPFGIPEPVGERRPSVTKEGAAPEDFPALIIAPGLAFDRTGNRLGHGGGYYDRFFAAIDEAGREYTSVGLCMDFQIVNQVPAGQNDRKVSGILTAKEFVILK